jgi:hypothetical protein
MTRSSPATVTPYDKLLERLDRGANHRDYPEGFGDSWTDLCVKAAWAIRHLTRASLQPATPTSCPYKGPFGCKCEPGECRYTPTAGEPVGQQLDSCGSGPSAPTATGARFNDPGCCMGMAPEDQCECAEFEKAQSATASDAVAREAKVREQVARVLCRQYEIDDGFSVEQANRAAAGEMYRNFLLAADAAIEAVNAARPTDAAATPSEPAAWHVEGPGGRWLHVHPVQMDELRSAGRKLRPLFTGVAQSVTEPSDEWCNAFLKATGEWIEPHEPETECGVPMECEITQEFADELNADARKQIRKGYAAACSIPSTQLGTASTTAGEVQIKQAALTIAKPWSMAEALKEGK